MRSVELFSGAGGLALGLSRAGFKHLAVVERDRYACDTIRANQERGAEFVHEWPLHQTDVRQFNYDFLPQDIELLAGGPPCQPFSLGGKHAGHKDERNMFPEVVRATRELTPQAFLLENVRGLTRQTFAAYFEYIILELSYPEITRQTEEAWRDHLTRLRDYHKHGRKDGLRYDVHFKVLNAADYGVPQRRERVFIIGFRSDLNVEWRFPSPSCSQDALFWSQWICGDYWERHGVLPATRPEPPARAVERVRQLRSSLFGPLLKPWRTVRDAICDLPAPQVDQDVTTIANHRLQLGARPYPGHTGSPLDEPAKTLKAGDHGVPGGENMLLLPSGEVRYFTVRESARLQTFPDDFEFRGSWTECMRQIGNAVPVELAHTIASALRATLSSPIRKEGAA